MNYKDYLKIMTEEQLQTTIDAELWLARATVYMENIRHFKEIGETKSLIEREEMEKDRCIKTAIKNSVPLWNNQPDWDTLHKMYRQNVIDAGLTGVTRYVEPYTLEEGKRFVKAKARDERKIKLLKEKIEKGSN